MVLQPHLHRSVSTTLVYPANLHTYIAMAPGLTDTVPVPSDFPRKQASAPLDIFPDGLKTTGQHPPLYDQIKPFEAFPKQITGPTVWKGEDFKNHPEKWTYVFSEGEIEEFSKAADGFLNAKIPLTGISKVGRMGIVDVEFSIANWVIRRTSPCPRWESCWWRLGKTLWTARDSSCSRASRCRNGGIISRRWRIWVWGRIWGTLLARTVEAMCWGMLRIWERIRIRLTRFEFIGRMLGMSNSYSCQFSQSNDELVNSSTPTTAT